ELTLGNIDKACTDCEVKHFTEEQTNSGSACSMCCIAESSFDYEGHKRNGDANYNKKIAIDAVLEVVEQPYGQYSFIDIPGGSCNTFPYTTLYHLMVSQRSKEQSAQRSLGRDSR